MIYKYNSEFMKIILTIVLSKVHNLFIYIIYVILRVCCVMYTLKVQDSTMCHIIVELG